MIRLLKNVLRLSQPVAKDTKLEFETVEPRVLFSATPLDSADESGVAHHDLPIVQEEAPAYLPARGDEPNLEMPQVASGDGALLLDGLNAYAGEMASEGRREIVFISTDIEDYEYLVSNLDSSYEVFLIDSESDGIGQIAAALEGVSGVDAIHLLSHGSEGRLFLAGTEVNAETIGGIHRDGLEAIRESLSEDADFLIYGCDFTAGEEGLAAAELLSTILGADIAASTDGTGHAGLGGDWDLETEIGLIESDALSLEGWNGLLAPIAIVNTNNATTLANNIIGSGITLGTATYTGSAEQAGTFTSATGYTPEWLGYSSGIILTTGSTSQIPGPNTFGGATVDAPSAGTGADTDLGALGGGTSFDSSILNFTFTPTSNRVTMQFTFGSDEYNEYVYSAFNDAMGVWVNGVQVALTPTGTPISVNSINQAGIYNPANGNQANDPNPANGVFDSSNPNLYINNEPGSGAYNTGMDGFTVTLSFVANVNIGVSNTIKIGIADIGDAGYDSWLFIREDSLTATTIAVTDYVATAVNTPVVIDALANDWDSNGDPLTITHILDKPITVGGPAVLLPSGSSVVLNANGTLTFTPVNGSTTDEIFTYTISDGTGSTAVGFVHVDINQTPVNAVPSAQTTTEDTNRIINGLAVSDADSTALTTTLSLPAGAGTITVTTGGGATISGNGSGTVTISGTAAQINAAIGSITYAPTADFNTGTPAVPINLIIATTDGVSTDTDTVAITVTPVADIVADTVSTNEDTAISFNAITGTNSASADNFENAGRAITSVTQGANGSVTFLANGQITYTPNLNFFGTDTFTYTVTSGGVTESATVTVNVAAVNDAPVNTVPAAQVATEDTNRIITGVSVADVDSTSLTTTLSIPGTTGTLSVLTGGGATITGNGTATVTVSGTAAQINAAIASITYVPLADFNTATAFNLTVATSDGFLTDTDTIAITVNAVADIVADTVATNEDTAISFNAITGTNGASADNFENAGRAITSVTQGANGSVTFLANGQITYTPNLNFFGTDTFTYTVTSGGVTETATVTVNVAAVNDAPVNTVPAAQVATEDTNRIITGVSVADVDSTSLTTTLSIPGTTGTLSVLTGGGATITGNGTATVTVSGTAAQINAAIASITYVPLADFNTATAFNLTVATSDGFLTDTDTIAITVNAVADIVADTVSTNEDTAISFNAITGTNGASADNFENAGRAITSVTQGANGSVTFLANGQITYTPNLNFFGTDTFTYTVTSGGVTETATVTVNVAAVNDAPVNTVPAAQVATEDTNRIITGVSVADVDSTSLTTTLSIPGTTGTLMVLTGGGATITGNGTATVVVSGTAAQINAAIASITYVPLADFNTATAFNLTVATSDGFLTGTDTIAITVNAEADIVADSVSTNEDTAISFNAITGTNGASADNFENAGRAITSVTQGANGSVTFLANGQITYTPNLNFFGTDTFTYTVTSGGVTETATVTVNVDPVNDAPNAVDDDFVAGENDGPVVVGNAITNNDTDVDGDDLVAIVQSGVIGSAGGIFAIDEDGTVTFNANGEFEDLALGETRETSFTYTISDGQGGTDTATVTVTVSGANDAPVVTVPIGTQWNDDGDIIELDLSGFFSDADTSDDLIYTATGLPAGLSLDPDTGILSGTIDSSASAGGPYAVEVTVNDGNGGLISQTFTWNVFNPAPIAEADHFTAGEDDAAAVVGNALINDSDPDGDTLSALVASGSGSNGGQFSIAADGAVTFHADGDFEDLAPGETRETTFTYTLVDADDATTTATITVTVTGANDAPVVVVGNTDRTDADSAVISLGTSAFFSDIDASDSLSFSVSGLPGGLGIDATTGVISGTIDSSASVGGPYFVEVTAVDESGASVTHSFFWTVTNPAPIAEADNFTANEDDAAAIVGNALVNDSDPDGDSYSAQVATGIPGSNGGVFSIAANGDVTFDPAGTFNFLAAGETAVTSFTYTLIDADNATTTATFTVEVTGENDAPVAVGTIATQNSADSDVIAGLDLSVFFTDPDSSDVLAYTAIGLPSGLTIDANTGLISGTIDSSASVAGSYSVTVTATDENGAFVTQSFTWQTSNPAPLAGNDDFSAGEDDAAAVVGNAILNNDSDPDGDALTALVQSGVIGSQGGLFSIAADGEVTFDPNGEFEDLALGESRTTSFTYTLTDADGATATAIVTVTVSGANDNPVTVGTINTQNSVDSAVISLDVSGAFSDTDLNDVLVYSATGLPAGLMIDAGTGIISGTIDSSASVTGSYSIEVTVDDGNGGTATQTFVWNVSNPAPVALNDAFTAGEDDAAAVVGNAITNNDSDPDGDLLTALVENGVAGSNGGIFSIAANGEVTFDPAGAFEDLAAGETRTTSFTYTLEDADGATSTATVTVTVTGVNDVPLTVGTILTQTNNDSDGVSLNVSGFFADTDSSDVLIYSATGLPGGLTIDEATGIISGTIDSSASVAGSYLVEVIASDGNGGTISQFFTWNVTNPAPVAVDDAFTVSENDVSGVIGNVIIGSDSDPDGDTISAIAESGVAGSNGGLFSIAANGDLTFDPNGSFDDLAAGETRETTFTYTLIDADGATDTATVTVTVTGVNDAPITVGTIATQSSDDSDVVSFDVSGFFADADASDVLSYTVTGLPAGLVIDEATGVISGTIDSSASTGVSYTVTVTADDSNGGTTTQTFTWLVSNPGPLAEDDNFTSSESAVSVVGNALGNDSDPDGDDLNALVESGVAGSNGGIFSIAADGEVTFDPNGQFEDLAAGETRTTSFTYTLVDADGATSTATVNVTVTGENDAPVPVGTASDQSNNDSDAVTLDVSGLFADPDSSDILTYSATGLPAGLSIDEDSGIISGTIASSASVGGSYTVIVTANDGKGGTVSQTFTWTISNPAPVAVDDTFVAGEDDALAIVGNAITGSDSDPDGDLISTVEQSNIAGTQGGLFSIAANGDVSFDPNGQFDDLADGETRTTSFTYTLIDADGATAAATVTVVVSGANDVPVTVGTIDGQISNDSDVVSFDVREFFNDVDASDTLSYSATGLPDGLVASAGGIISGTIASSASANGSYSVVVIADDGKGGSVSQSFTWVVNNPAPVAVDDDFAAGEDDDAAVVGNAITGSDSDPDGDTISVVAQSGVAGSNGGIFSIAANGEVTFDPNDQFEDLAAGETRTTSFTYTLIDADNATDTATVTVTVTGVNDAPVTVGTIAAQNNFDSDSVTLDVSGLFADTDVTDVLEFSATGLPAGLTIDSATGVISGTIGSSASAGLPYTVEITVSDGKGGSVSQTFTWTVSNPAPVAVDDFFTAVADDAAAVVGNAIIGSDSDPDGDTISAVVANDVAGDNGGLFSIAANGEVTFDPNGQFDDLAVGETRTTSFDYTLIDADGGTAVASVTVTVTGVNEAPEANGTIADQSHEDSQSIAPLDVSGFFSDVDTTDTLTYSVTGLPAGLVIDENTGIISGTLDSSASVGSPHPVVVTADDGNGGTATHTFTWVVTNPGPVAVDDAFDVFEDDDAIVVGNAITSNDSDPDGDTLSALVENNIAGSNGGLFSIAANGEVTFDANGDFEALAEGETAETSFTYTLMDADGATATATIVITVTGNNDAPVSVGTISDRTNNDSESVSLNVSEFFGDTDASDVLVYSATDLPAGLVIDGITGVISGTIASSASFDGPYNVVVTATDNFGASTSQTFTWTVLNPGPVALDDDFAAGEDDAAAIVGNVLANDSDIDGDALSVVAVSGVAGSNGGIFSVNATGDVTFDPNGAFESLAFGETAVSTFTYTLVDADGATSEATVTVTITGSNDTPERVGSIAEQTGQDSDTVLLDVSGSFSDPDASDELTYSAIGLPTGLVIDPVTGVISGTIDSSASVNGLYSVVVTATDEQGASITQSFTWTVTNPGPVAVNDEFGAAEDDAAAVVGNALSNDSDPDGDALSVQVQSGVAGTQGGLFSIAANGEVTFDTNGQFNDLASGEVRQTSFTYTLVDADGATTTATVTVDVAGENDAPVRVGAIATQDSFDSDVITFGAAAYFSDPDTSDVLSYSAADLPDGLTIDSVTGEISGTIASSASVNGPYEVVVTATDGNGSAVTQTFIWNVANPGPVAVDDAFTAFEDVTGFVGNVITNNDSDPDGDALTVIAQSGVAGINGGVFSIAANGDVTFDPNGEFDDLAFGESRTTSISYTLVDADGATATATVTVTVNGANSAPFTVGTVPTQSNNDADAVSLNVSGFFDDLDESDVLEFSASGLPAGLSIDSATGLISGTMDSSASVAGSYLVEVTAADGNGGTVSLSFTWNVANPAPIAVDDEFVADEDDGALVVGNVITGSDSDPDGDLLAVQVVNLVTGNEGGLFSIAANGDVTFDPNGEFEDLAAGETRATSITYTLVDADGATSTATVTITVSGANDAPITVGTVAAQNSIDGETIAAIDLSVHFADVDNGAVLSYTATGLPTGLVIDSVTGIISGTIDRSASREGTFDVEVTAADGLGGSVTQSFVWTVTNPAPVANDDAFTALEDDGLAVVGNAITNNDSDPDGDALSAIAGTNIAGSQGGLFSIAANGEVSFDPNGEFEDLAAGETRETSFTYTLVDADGATSTAAVTVTVTGENDAPVAVGSIATQSSVDSAVVSLATNAFFADVDASDVPAYSANGLPTGLVIDEVTGVISGTIASSASVAGPYTVVVTRSDGNGGTATQTLSWIVSNPAPIANDDTFTALEDDGAAVVGNAITNNDSDPDGDALSAVPATGVAGSEGGLFSIAANGEVTFDPNGEFEDLAAGETRATSFTYTVADADGATSQAVVTVVVTGENDAPVTVGVIGTQSSDDSDVVSLNVSGFFSDTDLTDTLTYAATDLPTGLVIDAVTGIISGTIDSSASVDGSFFVSVTASDDEGGSVTQTFTWTVSNPAPVAMNDVFGVFEDDAAAVIGNAITGNDSDPDGDTLGAVAVTNLAGSHGGLFSIAANGDVSFDPNGAFEDLAAGETRETSFTYTLVDADGATATATVMVTVTGMNDAPTTVGSIATRSNADSDVIVPLDVTGFFADADLTDVMEYSASGLPSGLTIDSATGIVSGTIDSSASTIGTYSVTVTAADGEGGSAFQTFTWLVSNPAPLAENDTYGAGEDDAAEVLGNALVNDSDPDGDALSVVAVSGASGSHGGLFSISSTGEVTFDPNGAFETLAAGETRETSFIYTLVDADGATSQATVTVTVTGSNDAPFAVGLIGAQVNEDSDSVVLDVSGFFGDTDASDELRFSVSGLPAGLTIDEETGIISGTIASSASASGPYTVVVTVDDGQGGTTTQTFTWTVTNPGPVAVADLFEASEDDAPAIVGNAITNNDSDPDGDVLSALAQNGVAGSQGGLFSIAANGDVTFDPNGAFETLAAGETRETSFTYTLIDADGATANASVTVTVTGENDAPVSAGPIATHNSIDGETITLDLSGFFSDPDVSDALSFSATGLPTGLSIDGATGIVSGTIAASASVTGPYTVLVTARDASGLTVSLTFTWNVTNPAPIAQNDAFAAGEDDAALVVGNVLGNDSDPDGDSLSVVPVSQIAGSEGGSFTIDVSGNVSFSPDGEFEDLAAGETRETAVSYTLVDADGATATATVTVTVTGANDAPVVTTALPDQSHQDSETITPVDVSGFFADVDVSDSLVYSISGLPAGLVFDEQTGIITGRLNSSASVGGPYLVNVTATDEGGENVTASFNWTVTNPVPVANDDRTGGVGNPAPGTEGAEDDRFTALEDDGAAVVGNALENDYDLDGDELFADVQTNVTGSQGGIFSIAVNGDVTFDPADHFQDLADGETRETTFTYTLVDADGGTATAVVTVTVMGRNDAPVVVAVTDDQDDADSSTVNLDMSVFFADVDLGDVLTYSATNLPTGLSIDESTGLISGTIDRAASGDGPFNVTVTATDSSGSEVTTEFEWTVTNPAPIAVDDQFDAMANGGVVVLGNVITGSDSDPDGDALATVPRDDVAGSNGGLFRIDADGNVTFDPNGAFGDLLGGQSRETSFTYTLIDADGAMSTATVTVRVLAVNAPPVPQSGAIKVTTGTRAETLGLSAPVDPDGDRLTITVSKLPRKGVLRLANGKPVFIGQVLSATQLENLVFDAPDTHKGKKPVTFRYKVTDGQVTTHAKVKIKIVRGVMTVKCLPPR